MGDSKISLELYRQRPATGPHERDQFWDPLLLSANWRLRRLLRHVETSFGRSLSFTGAAEICGLEKTYFCRFFQSQTGMTFSEWLMRIRIERAKNLLIEEHGSIAEIATAVGYKNITTFERHFKRCEKRSPMQFRKQLRAVAKKRETTIAADKYTMAAETPIPHPSDNCAPQSSGS
jgi:transcriptional regulator GlxA family with amidase domain